MSDEQTLAVYDAKAKEYAALVAKSEPDAALLAFMAATKPGGLVLDLGCGVANASAMMKARGFDTDAVDASAAMVELANRTHGIGAKQQRFEDLAVENHYEAVWANFSLLHARRAVFQQHLSQIHRAVKPGGIFHIGMKLGEGEMRDQLGRFYSYYSLEDLIRFLELAGFTVLEQRLGEGGGLSGESTPWATLLCRCEK